VRDKEGRKKRKTGKKESNQRRGICVREEKENSDEDETQLLT